MSGALEELATTDARRSCLQPPRGALRQASAEQHGHPWGARWPWNWRTGSCGKLATGSAEERLAFVGRLRNVDYP
jgi:hypothetical protein